MTSGNQAMRVVVDNSLYNSHTFNGYPYQGCMTWQKTLSIDLGQACRTAASSCWQQQSRYNTKHLNTHTRTPKQKPDAISRTKRIISQVFQEHIVHSIYSLRIAQHPRKQVLLTITDAWFIATHKQTNRTESKSFLLYSCSVLGCCSFAWHSSIHFPGDTNW